MTSTTNVLETAKNLAVVVGFVRKELSKRDKKLLENFNALVREHFEPLKDQLNKIPAPQKFVLPESVAHDANLQVLRESLEQVIEQNHSKVNSKAEQIWENLKLLDKVTGKALRQNSRRDKALAEALKKRTKVITKELREHSHDASYAALEHGHGQYALNENVQRTASELAESIRQGDQAAREALENARSGLSEAVRLLNEIISVNETSAKAALKKLAESFMSSYSQLKTDTSGRFDEFARALDTATKQTAIDLERRMGAFEKSSKTQFDSLTKSQEKGFKEGKKLLAEFAKAFDKDINAVRDEVTDLAGKQEKSVAMVLAKFQSLDTHKLDKKDALTKDDIEKIRKAVKDSIPIPENGKDAHEWLFRPHPSRKGVLLYKREDWKDWKQIVLIAWERGVPGGGGGAGPSVPGEVTVPATPVFHSETITTDTIGDSATDVWLVDASAGDVILTLPPADSRINKMTFVKKINTTGGNVIVLPTMGGDTTEYDTDLLLKDDCRPAVQLYSNGVNYIILGTSV